MYCKNCGKELTPGASVCLGCGFAVDDGSNYCPNCGAQTMPGAAVCVNCGVALTAAANANSKSKLVAGLLGIFLGAFGVHNFYLGYTGKAIAQLLISVLSCFTLAAVSEIWGLIEGILILVDKIDKDGKGNPLKE